MLHAYKGEIKIDTIALYDKEFEAFWLANFGLNARGRSRGTPQPSPRRKAVNKENAEASLRRLRSGGCARQDGWAPGVQTPKAHLVLA
jgi:hypothetical protein